MSYKEQIFISKPLAPYVRDNLDFILDTMKNGDKEHITHKDVVINLNALTETVKWTTNMFTDENWQNCVEEFGLINDLLTNVCFLRFSRKYREQTLMLTERYVAENVVWWFEELVGHVLDFRTRWYFYFEEDGELDTFFDKMLKLYNILTPDNYTMKEQANMIFEFFYKYDREFVKTCVLQILFEIICVGMENRIYNAQQLKDESSEKGEDA